MNMGKVNWKLNVMLRHFSLKDIGLKLKIAQHIRCIFKWMYISLPLKAFINEVDIFISSLIDQCVCCMIIINDSKKVDLMQKL